MVSHDPRVVADFLDPDHPKHSKVTPEYCLAQRWLSTASVIYIGKAPFRRPDDRGKMDGLWQRIKEFSGFIYRSRTDHKGGEDLRRLPTRDTFRVTWKETSDPSATERGLIREFRGIYGTRPFGNRDDGDGPLLGPKCC